MPRIKGNRTGLFLFQLVAIRQVGDNMQITEVETLPLVTRPEAVSYNYRAGTNISVRRNGFHSDESGIVATQIQIQGYSGARNREYKGAYIGGFDRLRMFRDRIFKLSHVIDKESAALLLNRNLGWTGRDLEQRLRNYVTERKIIGDDIVYAVNWYDFWGDEQYCVDINTFAPQFQAQLVKNTKFSISMTALGPPLETNSIWDWLFMDGYEIARQGADVLLDTASNIGDAILARTGFAQRILDNIEISDEVLPTILAVLPDVVDALEGNAENAFKLAGQRSYNKFLSSIGG